MSLKNNKFFRRLAAALMAGTMMVSMFGMTAFAEGNSGSEPSEPDSVTAITKRLNKGENLYLPATSFEFTIRGANADEVDGDVKNGVAVKAGTTGDVVFTGTNSTMAELPMPTGEDDANAEEVTWGTLNVEISENAQFSEVGVYRYVIEETDGDYPGVTYDTAKRYLDVYVMNSDSGSGYEYYYSIVNTNDTSTKGNGIITNTYSSDSDDLYYLKVTKNIEGDQGLLTAGFDFTVQITSDHENEKFYVVVYGENDLQKGEAQTITVAEETNTGSVRVTLYDDDYVMVYGLSAGDSYSVTETKANQDGYKTTYKINNEEEEKTYTGAVTGANFTGDVEITFINTRNASIPTGVVLNVAPYVAMVALAGVLAFVFLRRRNNNF